MTDAGQAGLGDFGDGSSSGDGSSGTDVRPDEEAYAVAGKGRQDTDATLDERSKLDERYGDPTGTVELAVTQVDYTIEGRGDGERPIMHVFGRREQEDGRPGVEHVRVVGFRPYFYAPTDSLEVDPATQYDRITGTETESEDGEPYEGIRGERLTKIFGQTPRDVGQVRDDFDHYEADVLFPNRLMIDKGIKGGVRVPDRRDEENDRIVIHHDEIEPADVDVEFRVNTFDIEVDDRRGFPEDGEEPIICIASHDSFDDEYVLWLYESPDRDADAPTTLPEYEPLGERIDVRIEPYDDEAEMLDEFLRYLDKTDPDVLTGWNFEDFDAPYLLDRLERLDPTTDLDLSIERLSRIDEVWRSDWGGPDVKGRIVFDLLYAYRRTQFTELESYRLDAVAEMELGVGKERYPGDIGDLWEQDPERLLEYNVRDVELCVELDRKQEVVAFWNEARKIVGCKLEDATTPGDAVDMYVLHEAHGQFVLPSKGRHDGEEFEGGAVFDPITGVKENVSVLDLKSLYPMSMATINASPETRVDPERYEGETYRTPTGIHFRKEPDGIIREMINELLTEREEKKSRRDDHDPGSPDYNRYDRQQAAVKVIMNSLYGVFGWTQFRLYDREMSAGVTSTNREVIRFTETAVNDIGYDVVYGDTDSVMIEFGAEATKSEAIDRSFDVQSQINDAYDEFASEELDAETHRFQIEFEKLYRRFFQAGTKKRYAGHIVWKEGNDVDDIDITGFEYQRSDIAPITKEVQHRVIDMIVRGDDIDDVKGYVREVIEEFETGDADLDDAGIPGGIGKRLDAYDTDTAQVRGAKYANMLLGTNFDRGSKPKRLYLEGVHPSFFRRVEREEGLDPQSNDLYREFKQDPDVICFEYADQVPDEFEVDWEKMLEKTLQGPIARILEALDVSWEEIRTGQEQTGLGSFM